MKETTEMCHEGKNANQKLKKLKRGKTNFSARKMKARSINRSEGKALQMMSSVVE